MQEKSQKKKTSTKNKRSAIRNKSQKKEESLDTKNKIIIKEKINKEVYKRYVMCNRGKFRKSLYDVCPLCKEKENNREHAANERRETEEIGEELWRNLKENLKFSNETSTRNI